MALGQDFVVYGAKQMAANFAGVPLSGFGDSEFLKITWASPFFEDRVGADGLVSRSENVDRRADVDVTLEQFAAANDMLSAIMLADRASNGAGVGPLLITHLTGRTAYVAEKAWIVKPPDDAFAKATGTRVWKIRVAALVPFIGGA